MFDRLILAEFAIIKYLAVCDGNVSDEEREVLNETRHSYFDDVSEKNKTRTQRY